MKSLEFSLTKVAFLIFWRSKIIFMMIKLQSLLKSIRYNQEHKAFACLSYLKPTLQWDPSSYYSGRQQQNGSQRNEVHFSVTKLCNYWYNSYVTKINEKHLSYIDLWNQYWMKLKNMLLPNNNVFDIISNVDW